MGGTGCVGGNLGLVLMGEAMLSKSLIQFSPGKWGSVPSTLFGLRPNYDRGNGGNLLQKGTAVFNDPEPVASHCQPTPLPTPWTLTGKSGSVSCLTQ